MCMTFDQPATPIDQGRTMDPGDPPAVTKTGSDVVRAATAGRRLRVVETGVYRGPHLYGDVPMIRIQLDLGALEDWPTDRLPGFTERLCALLPGLDGHGCCYHEPGGFVRRLRDGTWLGHVAEHVAIELQSRAGAAVTLIAALPLGAPPLMICI